MNPEDEQEWHTGRSEVPRLIAELHSCPRDTPEYAALLAGLTERNLPLVSYLARRFEGRGIPFDDLKQVGAIGLLKALDRFDPERGVEFSSFAAPTILGEIKRHFRDAGWLVRAPRRAQELQPRLEAARTELTQELHRAPTVAELAQRTDASEDLIIEALEVSHGRFGVSLDAEPDPDRPSGARQEWIAAEDVSLEHVELREVLRPVLAALPERERQILALRFGAGKTQTEIAELVGISQMHVSRLLVRTLAALREQLSDPTDADPPNGHEAAERSDADDPEPASAPSP